MKYLLSRFLVTCLLVLSSLHCLAETNSMEDIQILARVHSIKEAEALTGHAIELEDEGLSDILQKIKPEDEVILKGYMTYRPDKSDTKINMNPVFHIQSIHPVSLKRLGITQQTVEEPNLIFTTTAPKGPATIPVSAEVAGAMTMTASILLLQDLTTSGATQPMKADIEKATFLSAGALATGYFIWKQIKSPKK
jgi:hypothetical protein